MFVPFVIPFIPFLATGIAGFLTHHQLDIHVNKHHQGYVDYLNTNVPGSKYEEYTLEHIIRIATGPLFNNAAQHFNHLFFWQSLTAQKQEVPPDVRLVLAARFGSFDNFKTTFTNNASTLFGSGWCYLEYDKNTQQMEITQYSNADNPIKNGKDPLLTVDTWEHAWYIDYENRKAEYFAAYWDAVNWTFVRENLRNEGLI